ncbi:MAG: hypothetical protein HZA50_11145 [Planctomycetes bacterium]|nr:hypothetical protein [Planctomycetota bacterium]
MAKIKRAKLILAGLAVLSAWAIAPGQQAGEKVDIRLTFQPGRYEFLQEISVYDERAMDDARIGQRIDTVQTAYLRILGVRGDGRIGMAAALYKAGHVVSTGPMGVAEWGIALRYDSTDPDKQDPALAEAFKTLLDKKMVFEVPPARPSDAAAGKCPAPLVDVFNRRLGGKDLIAAMTDGFRQNLGEALVWQPAGLLPGNPVGVGQQWKGLWHVAIPGVDAIEVPLECKLASIIGHGERRKAVVEFSGKFAGPAEKNVREPSTLSGSPTTTPAGGTQATRPAIAVRIDKVCVDVKGTATFNLAGGITYCLESEQAVSLDMSLVRPDGKTSPAQASSKANTKFTATAQLGTEYNPLDDLTNGTARTLPASGP